MNRDIQFRAWDKEANQMYPNIQNHVNDKVFAFGYMIKEDSRFKVMQYTGIKDKNGVEIYEGDILEWDHVYSGRIWGKEPFKDPSKKQKAEVSWRGGKFMIGYEWNIDIAGNKYSYSEHQENHSMQWANTVENFEVIGNIHENPELIKIL